MKYEAWRISFQSSEAAARSAYTELTLRGQKLVEVKAVADELEAIFKDGDKMKLMALVPLGKITRLQQAIATIKQMGGE